ncbi:Xaa-Pro peptidase family protein [Dietzia cinnamea]|uniref:M24 family metallopeptidase n=1 Tax=Dietzia TaxID=37914 RepID=UPI000785F291|nr:MULTISPECIES: Xaa-Pro peptidase family protein [Dietzia]KZO59889.1 dipeptidase [Dietzia maris]MCT2058556.1 Xaa-Pro peptidase family protein [Dietzia cinnamea]MCT2097246.1 Xaa-Pro peptidase family protein [Dietzia cinnamea]
MTTPDPQLHSRRLTAVRDRAGALGIDHLVVYSGEDMSYLTGERMDSHERLTALVVPVAGGEPLLVLPALELTDVTRRAAERVGAGIHPWSDGTDPVPLVAGKVAGRVAVSSALPALHLVPLRDGVDGEVVLASEVIDHVRAVKTPDEVEQLAEAARRIDAVHARMGEFLRVGRTEDQAGELITAAIEAEGLTHAEFVIVGSGPHGADPHHGVSDRVIESGDIVVVDIGGPLPSGYHSDCTRTYSMGEPSAEVAENYEVLQEAQRLAREAVRPGVAIGEVDAAAREHLAAAGLGELFIHRTGHGIGLGLHEPPFVMRGADTVLEEGMTFSVEPGIYRPGQWGARLEDIVAVTADGRRDLNTGERGLRVL